jgi:CpeT/CpcT family protein DUF1001
MKTAQLVSMVLTALLSLTATTALAQGQDSTPGERWLLLMAEMLPGHYDNINQNYFDRRRKLPEADQHPRLTTRIRRVEAPNFGDHAFLWVNTPSPKGDGESGYRIATLHPGPGDDEVTMRHYLRMKGPIEDAELATLRPSDLRRTEGCDYVFKRRANQFRGAQQQRSCRFNWQGRAVFTDNTIELSERELFFIDQKFDAGNGERVTGPNSGEPYWLERAREFHCYADLPGVGGGRDEAFERHDDIKLHDKGGTHWFQARDEHKRTLGLSLQAVTWHVLNENNGNFNRNSLVLYVLERMEDGSVSNHGYTFTEPDAKRIGLNLKWMLANCAMTPRHLAKPEL